MTSRALVWLKRDLRLLDHAPLAAAAGFDAAVALYVIEPEWLASPEFGAAQLRFVLDSLAQLRAAGAVRGLPVLVRVGSLPEVFETLRREVPFDTLLSHEETGSGWTYARDLRVADWCGGRGVPWQEFSQTGVVRRLKTRSGWAGRWQARMSAPVVAVPAFEGARQREAIAALDLGELPTLAALGVAPGVQTVQPGGERAAWAVLEDFLHRRGHDYRRALSSPLSATEGCSRLSPHLAWGTISMRAVHQATEARIAALKAGDLGDRRFAHALRGFAGRLRWHCHFMQKLEDEPGIEFRNFARVYDGLRPGDDGGPPWTELEQARFEAWCTGRSGYPMVDACMRSLCATGWLNFRMRAMLVSFASYHLWLHWRPTGLFLARQFLDFEPGIHWSQMQMQSGTTGINTLRIYSPTRQALEHDPNGEFIRRWLPELARVPLPHLAEPWRMPEAVQAAAGCRIGFDYPAPIADDKTAVKHAKERLYGLRARSEARAEAAAIQHKHGSRKSGLPPSGGRKTAAAGSKAAAKPQAASNQLDLFATDANE